VALVGAGLAGLPVVAAKAPPPGARKACQVTVTGAEKVEWTGYWTEPVAVGGSGDVGAVSEYWMDEGQIRTMVSMLHGLGSKSEADKKKKVEAAMKRDPRWLWMLNLNCKADEGTLNLMTSSKSGSKYVPLGPKSYPVAGGGMGLGEVGGPGEFAVQLAINKEPYIASGGSVEIKKFDMAGVSGSFSLQAKSRAGKQIEVKGTFDYPCTGGRCKR
jgi:hypothetical protein